VAFYVNKKIQAKIRKKPQQSKTRQTRNFSFNPKIFSLCLDREIKSYCKKLFNLILYNLNYLDYNFGATVQSTLRQLSQDFTVYKIILTLIIVRKDTSIYTCI